MIVCDNNSTDRTAQAAREAGARVVFEPVNQISRARNAGARVASGDWLLFIDADSYLHPATLADLLRATRHKRCAGGGCVVGLDEAPLAAHAFVGLWNLLSRAQRWAAGSFVFCAEKPSIKAAASAWTCSPPRRLPSAKRSSAGRGRGAGKWSSCADTLMSAQAESSSCTVGGRSRGLACAGCCKARLYVTRVGSATSTTAAGNGASGPRLPALRRPVDHPYDEGHAFLPEEKAPLGICAYCLQASRTTPINLEVHPGDRILVNKLFVPRRWDFVTVRSPVNPGEQYVKRLIGLPGEEVVIKEGQVWVNGNPLQPPAEIASLRFTPPAWSEADALWGSPGRPAKLGPGENFVVGDFAERSADSRTWGKPIPQSDITGVVTLVYYPISRWRIFR